MKRSTKTGNNTLVSNRKTKRRQDRSDKKKKRKIVGSNDTIPAETSLVRQYETIISKSKSQDTVKKHKDAKQPKIKSTKKTSSATTKNNDTDPYANLPPDVAAAMRRDDEEIAALEAKMGMTGGNRGSEKHRLYKEYAKQECYGDDFGSFLEDVDNMVMRVIRGGESGDSDNSEDDDFDTYRQQFGLGDDGDGYSDDDDVHMVHYLNHDDDNQSEEDADDEVLPMKGPDSDDEQGSNADSEELSSDEDNSQPNAADQKRKSHDNKSHEKNDESDEEAMSDDNDELNPKEQHDGSDPESDDNNSDDESPRKNEPDHNVKDTYRPAKGEDIYGKPIDKDTSGPAPKKYVPPHMRKQPQQEQQHSKNNDEMARQEEEEATRKTIRRSLNNALNRLSEDTLISVAQSVAQLYQSNPTPIVNECIWSNLRVACIERPHLMTGLIPVYVACVAGVHFQLVDSAQVGEYVLEMAVQDLWKEIKTQTNDGDVSSKQQDGLGGDKTDAVVSKEASNLMLALCYLYNYGIVHCSFLYSIIRTFLESFRELEVELLLLILSHCGRALRSDDPLALKEIVILVQKRALELQKGSEASPLSSRVEYMVSAMMDLKNNKRHKKDTAYAEKVAKIRKLLGQVKSSSSAFRSSDGSSLRISLDDILNVSTKGRWWKVGASWVGNQYRFTDDNGGEDGESQNKMPKADGKDAHEETAEAKEDAKLLKLAAKARMNTENKRAIFCIIMKSADCDDAFEKLTRAGYLKNRKERDTVRVLMECCGNEKTYNPFYAHLAARLCDYQPQCKFSMQLAFWDVFKQFEDSVSIRKAANLAKLLFHLVLVHPVIKMGVLKALDLSSPEDLTEPAMIFLTIFFSHLLEYFDDPSDLKRFLESEVKKQPHGSGGDGKGKFDPNDDDGDVIGGDTHMNDDSGLGPSISIFLLQTMKASPKYKKGSKFRSNLKAAVKACDTEDFFF